MIMKALIFLLTSFLSFNLWAQKDHDQIIRDFLEQRRRMMEEMMKHFNDDFFNNDDFDKMGGEKFFGLSSGSQGVRVERRTEKDGSIVLEIIPESKDVQFEINTDNQNVTIKGKVSNKVDSKSQTGGKSQSVFESSFQQSYSIPYGYKALNPEQKGDSIILKLVPSKDAKKLPQMKSINPAPKKEESEDLIPIDPNPGDITI
jgi:HSP20 family molecular chaperone IbpA